MPNHLSILGIAHTAIGIIAIGAAVYALAKQRKINPFSRPGKIYIVLTVIACLSSLPIMNSGHPTAGHALAVLVLLLLPVAIYARTIKFFGNKADYIQTVIMSSTLFFSMIPAVVETLTRLPLRQPLASSQDSPVAKLGVGILLVVYITGVAYQVFKMRAVRRLYMIPAETIES